VLVILHGLDIIPEVEVSIPQLAVDGRQCAEIICPRLKGCFKESNTIPALASLAQLFPL